VSIHLCEPLELPIHSLSSRKPRQLRRCHFLRLRPSIASPAPLPFPLRRTWSRASCPARRCCPGPFPRGQSPPVRVPAPLSPLLPSRPHLSHFHRPCCFYDAELGPGHLAPLAAAAQGIFRGTDRLPRRLLRRPASSLSRPSRSLASTHTLSCSPSLSPSWHGDIRIEDGRTSEAACLYRGRLHIAHIVTSVSRTITLATLEQSC
jgi:hypothetical protein